MSETFGDDPQIKNFCDSNTKPKIFSIYDRKYPSDFILSVASDTHVKADISWITKNVNLSGEEQTRFREQIEIYHCIKERSWCWQHDGRTVGQENENDFIRKMIIDRMEREINDYIYEWFIQNPCPSENVNDSNIFTLKNLKTDLDDDESDYEEVSDDDSLDDENDIICKNS